MARRPRFKLYRGWASQMMSSVEVVAAATTKGKAAAGYAAETSPRKTGRYARSFTVETVQGFGKYKDRRGARVANTAPYADQVEMRLGVLARTVDYAERTDG